MLNYEYHDFLLKFEALASQWVNMTALFLAYSTFIIMRDIILDVNTQFLLNIVTNSYLHW